MKIISLLGGAGLCAAVACAPASASSVVTGSCVSVTDAAGCLFSGNINGNADPGNANSFLNAQNAYNALSTADIALTFITSSDDGNFGGFGSFTGFGSASGTWSLPGYDVQYIAVKASNKFVLYAVSGSSGSWDTFDIPFRRNPHGISHLAFFGGLAGAVPEPSAWALMILGFGAAGAAMRRRKTSLRYA